MNRDHSRSTGNLGLKEVRPQKVELKNRIISFFVFLFYFIVILASTLDPSSNIGFGSGQLPFPPAHTVGPGNGSLAFEPAVWVSRFPKEFQFKMADGAALWNRRRHLCDFTAFERIPIRRQIEEGE